VTFHRIGKHEISYPRTGFSSILLGFSSPLLSYLRISTSLPMINHALAVSAMLPTYCSLEMLFAQWSSNATTHHVQQHRVSSSSSLVLSFPLSPSLSEES
jgi:hypothetical protein